jgi:hypothetical protein
MSWQIRLLVVPFAGIFALLPLATVEAQGVRRLAPGVLRVIPPEPNEEETFLGPVTLDPLTRFEWTPNYAAETQTLQQKASKVVLRQNVWNLEFSFKPLRMVHVDIPQPSGRMQRKLIWYMVYRVRNLGEHLTPVPIEDEYQNRTFGTQRTDEVLNVGAAQPAASVRFYPHFVLETRREQKAYLDRIIPVALPVIAAREADGGRLYNSVDISRIPVPVGREETDGVWGVAMWEDVDPRVDFFSILVQGLTNAYRTTTTSDGSTVHRQKTLQLNFWRPGDTHNEHEKEIRYGIPAVADPEEQNYILSQYGISQRLDHLWAYR